MSKNPHGIAVDEQTAVCVDALGIATVFGINNAFFLQRTSTGPEICVSGKPLTWNNNSEALKVYRISGSVTGNGSFNLNNYSSASGGIFLYYYVINGVFGTH
jgi:cyanophycinase-like exopeptidase